MAHKTPVLLTTEHPSYPGAAGPHLMGTVRPRKNLISQMERRAKQNARRFIRDTKRRLARESS